MHYLLFSNFLDTKQNFHKDSKIQKLPLLVKVLFGYVKTLSMDHVKSKTSGKFDTKFVCRDLYLSELITQTWYVIWKNKGTV